MTSYGDWERNFRKGYRVDLFRGINTRRLNESASDSAEFLLSKFKITLALTFTSTKRKELKDVLGIN